MVYYNLLVQDYKGKNDVDSDCLAHVQQKHHIWNQHVVGIKLYYALKFQKLSLKLTPEVCKLAADPS